MYYLLDIENDSNKAMQARKYLPPTPEDFEVEFEARPTPELLTTTASPTLNEETKEAGIATLNHNTQDEIHQNGIMPLSTLAPTYDTHQNGNILSPPTQSLPSPVPQPIGNGTITILENPNQIKASREDFYKFMIADGSWTDLFAMAVN